jgi:hypothetical protein
VLLRPLPYIESGRLVIVWEDASFVGFKFNTPAPANYIDWRARNQAFSDMAATRSVTWMVLRRGLRLSCLGLSAGAVLAFALSSLLRSLLFGVTAIAPPICRVRDSCAACFSRRSCAGTARRIAVA